VKGHKVSSTEIQELDYGDLLATTHGVYFGGTEKGVNFRIPYSRILRFNAYSDAIGICKDGGREQIFAPQYLADSGWFWFNLLQALSAKSQHAAASVVRVHTPPPINIS
jgi:hypothetical protein